MQKIKWELIFVLPNLNIEKPYNSEYISIVPFGDERLQKILSSSKVAKILTSNFRTETGEQVKPCALIWSENVPDSAKNINAVVDFRNSLAISCLIHGCERAINSNNVSEPTYSDHFDFSPVTLSKKGEGFVISTPSTIGIWPKVDEFYGHTYPHIPIFEQFKAVPDKFLVEKILKQWTHRYIAPARNSEASRLLLRSLEVAYQALLSPYRHSTLYEFGTYLSLWTSAFEILAQKGQKKKVGYKDVLELLGQFKWSENKLDNRRYNVFKEKSKPKGNLVQKLYRELNDARNDFFHGNPVTERRLFPFRNKDRPPLQHLAPVLYWTALSVYLPRLTRRKKVDRFGIAIQESWNKFHYMEAILSAIGVKSEELYRKKK